MQFLLWYERTVAPLVGAWIEIAVSKEYRNACSVAPLVGAWIEIFSLPEMLSVVVSLPLWERGLKSV